MKRLFAVLAVITLSLVVVSQVFAGYTVKPRIEKTTGTGQVWTGNIIVKAINLFSSTSGDHIAVYNANIATGPVTDAELEFEIGISANNSSAYPAIGADGVNFSAGVYVASNRTSAITTVEFDY